jgi:nicotinamide-nucleotide amidase
MLATNAALVEKVSTLLLKRDWKLVSAESCTGGGLSYCLTARPGSSQWFDRGLVTYSNAAKMELLGVKAKTLDVYGAVSAETAIEMAEGALRNAKAEISISITGISGPDGGTKEKPVGTIWIAVAASGAQTLAQTYLLQGNREEIRVNTISQALQQVYSFLQNLQP